MNVKHQQKITVFRLSGEAKHPSLITEPRLLVSPKHRQQITVFRLSGGRQHP